MCSTNARRRWPAVDFRVINVAVQGPGAAAQIIDALAVLDRDPAVDVIIVARGGGSVEDLLPFSDEALCRAVFSCRTPVISAIGHETDTAPGRLRRRRPGVDPDRRRQAGGAGPRRGAGPDRRPGPGWTGR